MFEQVIVEARRIDYQHLLADVERCVDAAAPVVSA
jgi:hypothetical protein